MSQIDSSSTPRPQGIWGAISWGSSADIAPGHFLVQCQHESSKMPRKPTSLLLLEGGYRKDRHATRVLEPKEGIGSPPEQLSLVERSIWRDVAKTARWLRAPDRNLLEAYCHLVSRARADFDALSAARLSVLVNISAKLGLSPRDRASVTGSERSGARLSREEALELKYFGELG